MGLLGIVVAGATIPETGPVAGAVAGLKTAAVAVVAQAVLAMAQRLTPDVPRLALAAVAMAIALLVAVPGRAAGPDRRGRGHRLAGLAPGPGDGRGDRCDRPSPSRAGPAAAARRSAWPLAWVAVLAGSWLVALATVAPGIDFLAALVRAGALVFGGGHVVLPLLDAGVVAPGWVTPDAFLAGYGAAQALPGPLFSFGAYLGAVSTAGPGRRRRAPCSRRWRSSCRACSSCSPRCPCCGAFAAAPGSPRRSRGRTRSWSASWRPR